MKRLSSTFIYIIDDDPDYPGFVRDCFLQKGYNGHIIMAGNGRELIDHLSGLPEDLLPGLILLDLDMPEMDGFTVLKNIKQDLQWRSIPVVVFTSGADVQNKIRVYEMGANSIIQKPARQKDLGELINSMMQLWLSAS